MNREIKFRAFFSGGQMKYNVGVHPFMLFRLSSTDLCEGEYNDNTGDLVVSPTVYNVMQFTGLKDKNGVEIYEGDICKVIFTPQTNYRGTSPNRYESRVEIEFNDCQFKATNISAKSSKNSRNWKAKWISSFEFSDFEVIGNIHENPELV